MAKKQKKPVAKATASSIPEDATPIILDSISEGVFTVGHDWRITSFNKAAEEITGVPRGEAIGRRCCDVFRSSMCESDCALRRTMESGRTIIGRAGYIVSPEGRRVPISVSTALLRDAGGQIVGGVETFRDLSLVEELRKEIEGRVEVADMVSRSPLMRAIFDILPQVAASESTVLIQGETGTGKELLARAIHGLGRREKKPFVAINCGALPDTLLESELFGYRAGAFTGAEKDKPGRFALAEGGTIFLDEIGDVSAALQVRLLRVLQERTYEPLGGTESLKADVRVIAASNRDLAALVREGAFRQDLYYRINVVRLELPPLRRRKEDIPLLLDRFIQRLNRIQGRRVAGIRHEALALLMAHEFPGNIRELENVIEHAFVLCGDGPIEPAHLPSEFGSLPRPAARMGRIAGAARALEAQAIMDALKRNKFNRLAAARDLGVHKSTLFRKIKSLGLQLPDTDGRASNQ